jgi:DNA (cytosine-5)-methyltransferase 1
MRPGAAVKLLDLFCGAGGCSMGYAHAGFDVVGVDLEPQPDYPFEFHQADAMSFPLDGFDAIHASPPCQGETSLRVLHQDREYERLLVPTLERFAELDVPWIVENVDNAEAPAHIYKVRLCGSSFGLRVRRHRWFWSNVGLLVPPCDHRSQTGRLLGVYGNSDGAHEEGFKHPGRKRGPRQATTVEARQVMGMPWVTKRRGLTNAIPPAYTEYLGRQLRDHIEREAAA